jgi:hypothetical protein
MAADKKEFKPILPVGIHSMSIEDFRLFFVERFPQSARRKLIFNKFLQFFEYTLCFGVITEIWLNGSFVTEKPEPGDIDVVMFMDSGKLNNLMDAQKSFLLNITDIQLNYLTDVRYAMSDDANSRSYWRGWYGFSRDEQPKGFVRLKLEDLK